MFLKRNLSDSELVCLQYVPRRARYEVPLSQSPTCPSSPIVESPSTPPRRSWFDTPGREEWEIAQTLLELERSFPAPPPLLRQNTMSFSPPLERHTLLRSGTSAFEPIHPASTTYVTPLQRPLAQATYPLRSRIQVPIVSPPTLVSRLEELFSDEETEVLYGSDNEAPFPFNSKHFEP